MRGTVILQDEEDVYFLVDYYYSPPEPMVRYYPDGSGYPGCDAQYEFFNVRAKEEENTRLVEEFDIEKYRDRLQELVDEDIDYKMEMWDRDE